MRHFCLILWRDKVKILWVPFWTFLRYFNHWLCLEVFQILFNYYLIFISWILSRLMLWLDVPQLQFLQQLKLQLYDVFEETGVFDRQHNFSSVFCEHRGELGYDNVSRFNKVHDLWWRFVAALFCWLFLRVGYRTRLDHLANISRIGQMILLFGFCDGRGVIFLLPWSEIRWKIVFF